MTVKYTVAYCGIVGVTSLPCSPRAEMVSDEDATVRAQVLHTLCDGSPPELEARVREALEVFNRDADRVIRRRAHKVMAVLLRTGKWNIL